jgi:hypothetical protein
VTSSAPGIRTKNLRMKSGICGLPPVINVVSIVVLASKYLPDLLHASLTFAGVVVTL